MVERPTCNRTVEGSIPFASIEKNVHEIYEKVIKKYPNLYTHCKYIACGAGWRDLIDRTSCKLEELISTEKEYPSHATQVKEKFGELRIYMSTETDEMTSVIEQAEEESKTICEECGRPGKLREFGWISTLCDKHFEW